MATPSSEQRPPKKRPTAKRPKPPFPEQHLDGTGSEANLEPRPEFRGKDYRPAGKLQGKVAIITGGDSGIGRAVATLYAKEGADVAIIYFSHEKDAEVTRAVVEAEGARCLVFQGDVADRQFCFEAVARVVELLGGVDILVSNAAVQTRVEGIEGLLEEQLERTFRVNVFGYVFMVQACLPHLGRGSAIIATGSETGLFGSPKLPDYSATKGAIHTLTKTLAKQLVERGIRVNAVAPGPVWTPLNPADDGLSEAEVARFGEKTAMGRPAQPDEIAPAFVFFASNADSSFVTGQVLAELGDVTG